MYYNKNLKYLYFFLVFEKKIDFTLTVHVTSINSQLRLKYCKNIIYQINTIDKTFTRPFVMAFTY